MSIELQSDNRGNRSDYVLGTSLGWDAFDVVRFRGTEGLSELFEYDILLARSAELPLVDIAPVVNDGATLRIATEARWRSVHGIVAEAELVDQTSTLVLYRAVLVPHLWRAGLRRRCRTFVDKSIKEIVTAVLESSAPGGASGGGLTILSSSPTPPPAEPNFKTFSAPQGLFRWAATDPSRIEEKRAFTVQYNESDLNFVKRLLEAEGISFFFEHGVEGAVLTLSDRPGHAPLFPRDAAYELVTGAAGAVAGLQEAPRRNDDLPISSNGRYVNSAAGPNRPFVSPTPSTRRRGLTGRLYRLPPHAALGSQRRSTPLERRETTRRSAGDARLPRPWSASSRSRPSCEAACRRCARWAPSVDRS